MTKEQKAEILAKISVLLDTVTETVEPTNIDIPEECEMLTIKQCLTVVKGLSEHTLRLLIAKGEIASIRTGQGKTGKILVPKTALINYICRIQGKFD